MTCLSDVDYGSPFDIIPWEDNIQEPWIDIQGLINTERLFVKLISTPPYPWIQNLMN